MEIYLQVDNDTEYFNSVMSNIVDWGKERNCNIATANMALHDGFIKESAILCQKSIRTAYILTNILDYLIGERYNGRQI